MGNDSRSSKRKKKRSQKHSKKSRSTKEKSKTKKPKRHHDSDSSSGEDVPSKLSLSCSSSSSEDNYRSKKRGRSRDRRARKSSKKRTKRGRYMSDTSDESPLVKKKRKSMSSRDSKLKKKKYRKIRRRERSISSCSPSRNFSGSEHSDDSGREYERKEEKSETKKRKRREMSRERSVNKSRHSSRSYSPYNHNEERMDCQPKRLKSVIVAEIEKEEPKVDELVRDSHKDEIVYDHDDYPSKSNDSHDGPSGKDAVTYSDDAGHEKTRSFEDPNREAISPVVRASELSENQSLGEKRTEQVIPSSVEPRVIDHVNVGLVPDNLEAKLRQKALENLLKRQTKRSANISTNKKEYHPGPCPEPNKQVSGQTELESKSDVKLSLPVQNESVRRQTNKEGKNVVVHSTSALGTLNNNNQLPCYSAEKGNASVGHTLVRPKVGLSTPTRRLLGSSNTWRRESAPQEPLKSNQTLTKETDFSKGVESAPPANEVVKADNTTASEPSPSVVKSTKIETKEDDDSEFQQKTMTVMRGGELVQVSYKVKIPKKAPALARRQLKR